uniref:Retrotransposon gag domain-containing protein n=1 Tax=Oryza punctata TaxID=4537 RepID=A0A0E0MIX7_ORYPU
MVSKTRSKGSMVDMEEMNEVRTYVTNLKKDLADLKNLKSEVKEIKNLLLELCKQKSVEEVEEAKLAVAAAARNLEAHPTEEVGTSEQRRTEGNIPRSVPPCSTSSDANVIPASLNQWIPPLPCSIPGVGTFGHFPPPIPIVPIPNSNLGGFIPGPPIPPLNFPHLQSRVEFMPRPFQGNPGVRVFDDQRNFYMGHQGEGNHYVEAVIKGPRLEIPLFSGEEPVDWLKQCEKFYEITGTPADQWVNLAIAHLQGRAAKWFRGVSLPWQLISWPQWCTMICTRFSTANVHETVELFQNVKQFGLSVDQYIDKFEEYMDLVRRDHPYLQEQYFTSCFIGGLRGEIKHDVCGYEPQGLLESYWYAKNCEKAAIAKRAASNFNRNNNQNQNAGNQGRNAVNRGPPRGDGDRREEKKCWFCEEPWFPRHQCKVKQALHTLLMEEEGEGEGEGDKEKVENQPT